MDVSLYRDVALKKVTAYKENSYTNHQKSIIMIVMQDVDLINDLVKNIYT